MSNNILPPLTTEEFEALKADIERNGVLQPVSVDEDGNVLDGYHRLKICPDAPRRVVTGLTGPEKIAFTYRANLTRRNLSPVQKAEIKAKMKTVALELKQEGKSQAEVGALLGVAQQTVSTWLNNTTITNIGNSCEEATNTTAPVEVLDSRVKVTAEEYPVIHSRIESGETQAQVAADYGISQQQISTIARKAASSDGQALQVETEARDLFTPEVNIVYRENDPLATWNDEPIPPLTRPHIANNSGDNEWYTPPEYIAAAREVMGEIDLDPASSETANEVVGAKLFYDCQTNGLDKSWLGNVWLNPPYSRGLVDEFMCMLADYFDRGDISQAITLTNNATETKWFQRAARSASAMCFPEGRVTFWHPDKVSAPLQGQAILYFGDRVDQFIQAFGRFGIVCLLKKS